MSLFPINSYATGTAQAAPSPAAAVVRSAAPEQSQAAFIAPVVPVKETHGSNAEEVKLDQAVEAAARIGATRTRFTHVCHDLGYVETCARLPPGMELAYDGQVLDVE